MHTLVQKFCIADCDWLQPASASKERNRKQKPNQVEIEKRRELLQEFLYWFIDGFVMDLAKVRVFLHERTRRLIAVLLDCLCDHRIGELPESYALLPPGRLERHLQAAAQEPRPDAV